MVRFIDDYRAEYGVEPICQVLPIAPSTYYTRKTIEADPTKASARAQRDAWLRPEVRRVWMQNFQVYGVEKVYKQLNREGIGVARPPRLPVRPCGQQRAQSARHDLRLRRF